MSLDYDLIAEAYDELFGEEQSAKYRALLNAVSIEGDLIDVGCGTGLLSEYLGECYHVCVDKSLPMLKVAKRRLSRRPASDAVCGDAEMMPFRDKCVGNVVAFTVVHEAPGLADEAKRIARRGGLIAISLLRKRGELRPVLLGKLGRPERIIDMRGVKDIIMCWRACEEVKYTLE